MAQFQAGETSKAEKSAHSALQQQPDDTEIRNWLATDIRTNASTGLAQDNSWSRSKLIRDERGIRKLLKRKLHIQSSQFANNGERAAPGMAKKGASDNWWREWLLYRAEIGRRAPPLRATQADFSQMHESARLAWWMAYTSSVTGKQNPSVPSPFLYIYPSRQRTIILWPGGFVPSFIP